MQTTSLLRIVQGHRATLFGATASWSRTADGVVVNVGGRAVSFKGLATVDHVFMAKGNLGRRIDTVNPVTCESCVDQGGGGVTMAGHGSVQNVTADTDHMDVTFQSGGNDEVTVSGVDANGNTYGTFVVSTDFTSGQLANLWLDASVFPGGAVYPHGTVTVSVGGRITGTGGW
jgi:hypothetical protein